METYTLINLLTFFKNQQKHGYNAIEAILEILEDEGTPEHIKPDVVLSILRQFGLMESGLEYQERIIPYQMDCLKIPIINHIIEYDCILN